MRREGGVGSYIRGVTPVARGGATGPPVARGGATGPPAAPVGWAQWSPEGGGDRPPVARGGATCPFFCQGPHCEFEEKKYT